MKKILYISILLLFAILSFNSCTKDFKAFTPKTINPILILKGELTGSDSETIPQQNMIITNQNDWNTLIIAMNKPSALITANVDFDYYEVIAVFSDIKLLNGYSIEITEIIEYRKDVSIKVENINTGGTSPGVKQSFHIVKIPKTNKAIRFISINVDKANGST